MDSIEQYRRIAASYDRKVRWGEDIRRQAIAEFDLRMSNVVLDIGCGTGLSFPLIEEAIGPSGRLIGVEQSPEMLALARARVTEAGWMNVTLVEASAEDATIPAVADALIFFRVHDIVRSRIALQNVFRYAKPGARVLIVGTKWAPWWLFPLNLAIGLRLRSVAATCSGFGRPLDGVEHFVPNLSVQSVALGTTFIARGTTPSP